MKKKEVLSVLGLFTATGLMLIAMGLLSMPQDPSLSLVQLLQQLWVDRPVFSGVMMVYFAMMFICDAWVAVGLLHDNHQSAKRDSLKTSIARRKALHAPSQGMDLEKDLNLADNRS